MAKHALEVRGLGKRYRRGQQRAGVQSFAELVSSAFSAPLRRYLALRPTHDGDNSFWALRDVSFTVEPGEVVGIIGFNGSGKSTLLKMLSRIVTPTTGEALVRGRMGSLLEVGTGFHPEMTGRENIYLNGSLLGMSRAEIRREFDAIVDFAQVSDFLDTPVKRYSSGMYVRLGFAVAAHLLPEILIVDEVLAVGDAAFRAKCLGKMDAIARAGRTVLFVSHNMSAVAQLCHRVLLLDKGRCVFDGPVSEAVEQYLNRADSDAGEPLASKRPPWATPLITDVTWSSPQKLAADAVPLGSDLDITVRFQCNDRAPLIEPALSVIIHRLGHGPIGGVSSLMTGAPWGRGEHASGVLHCRLPRLALMPGVYAIDVRLGDGGLDLDGLSGAARFRIMESDVYGTGRPPFSQVGVMYFDADWRLAPAKPAALQPC